MTFRWGALALAGWMLLAPLQARSEAEPLIKLPSPLGAHRGGRAEFPENTAYAYREAAKRWPQILLEGDIHQSADGIAVMMHDRDVDRTTNGSGPVRNMTLEQLQQLDAAYHFTTDDGKTFPLRGQGITVPTFAEALRAAPKHWFLIEMKDGPNIVEATLAALRETGSEKRVIIASFNPIFMRQLREKAPEILTCYDTQGAMKMLLALRGAAWDAYVPESAMLTYSPGLEKTLALTPDEIIKLQSKGVHIQVHTINDEPQMRRYLDLGVDSILTDYPTRLHDILEERKSTRQQRK